MANNEHYAQIIFEKFQHETKILAEAISMHADKLEELQQKVNCIENRLDYGGIPKHFIKNI